VCWGCRHCPYWPPVCQAGQHKTAGTLLPSALVRRQLVTLPFGFGQCLGVPLSGDQRPHPGGPETAGGAGCSSLSRCRNRGRVTAKPRKPQYQAFLSLAKHPGHGERAGREDAMDLPSTECRLTRVPHRSGPGFQRPDDCRIRVQTSARQCHPTARPTIAVRAPRHNRGSEQQCCFAPCSTQLVLILPKASLWDTVAALPGGTELCCAGSVMAPNPSYVAHSRVRWHQRAVPCWTAWICSEMRLDEGTEQAGNSQAAGRRLRTLGHPYQPIMSLHDQSFVIIGFQAIG
jgi:hypothetical protein